MKKPFNIISTYSATGGHCGFVQWAENEAEACDLFRKARPDTVTARAEPITLDNVASLINLKVPKSQTEFMVQRILASGHPKAEVITALVEVAAELMTRATDIFVNEAKQ